MATGPIGTKLSLPEVGNQSKTGFWPWRDGGGLNAPNQKKEPSEAFWSILVDSMSGGRYPDLALFQTEVIACQSQANVDQYK